MTNIPNKKLIGTQEELENLKATLETETNNKFSEIIKDVQLFCDDCLYKDSIDCRRCSLNKWKENLRK